MNAALCGVYVIRLGASPCFLAAKKTVADAAWLAEKLLTLRERDKPWNGLEDAPN